MSNFIRQFRPPPFNDYGSDEMEFSTLEDLLLIPFVQEFWDGRMRKSFGRFVMWGDKLVAQYDGPEHLIVGVLANKDGVDALPVIVSLENSVDLEAKHK